MRAEPRLLTGLAALVAACLVALNLGALALVGLRAEAGAGLSSADWAAVRFTLVQAGLSSVVSVALAIPVARALARRRFVGRDLLITIMGAPFILPVMVAVSGLLAVFGARGLISQGLALLGLPPLSIYGLHGVVLAHVFFNLPLSVRLILQGWSRIPSEHLRLAASLGFGPWARLRHIEGPMLARVVPGALAVVFLVCLSSFAVALTLGGGPRATTVELAIYQAFRFDFDLGRAALLALVQGAMGLVALVALARLTPATLAMTTLDRPVPSPGRAGRMIDSFVISAAAVFLLVPLAVVVLRGLPALSDLPAPVWQAALTSVRVTALSMAILAPMVLILSLASQHSTWPELAGALALLGSPMVIGTGVFLAVYPVADPADWAVPVTALVNAAMALPFALRAVLPALRQTSRDYDRVAQSLGMGFWPRFRLILWPRLRRPFGFAMGLGAALAMGDLGVIALFAQAGNETLPLQMQRLLGAYRSGDAAGAALLLLLMAGAAFVVVERAIGGTRHASV